MEVVTGPDSILREDFCRLVETHQTALLRTCYLILRDRGMAEDAVQETFLKAYRAADTFRGQCSEKTWLMRIAVNTCRDMRRRAWFRYMDRRITPEEIPEAAVPFAARDDSLTQAIMALPPREKETLLLYYYHDMTVTEIGESLHLSVSAVSNRLKRGRERLKALLEGDEQDE